jgi:hypothetical protein
MNTLTIYRSAAPNLIVDIDDRTIFTQKLMTEHRIVSEFYTRLVPDILIGDYVTLNGENFYINRLPTITKLDNASYQNNVEFESVWYELRKKLFVSIDGLVEYGYTGNATNFITNIVANMNSVGFPGGWSVGTIEATEEKTIVFSNESCSAALIKVAETFALEFSITTKSISLQKSVGAATSYTFTYGKNTGLYKLTREQISDQNIVTKVYGFGSTANIPYTYRNRAKRLVFSTDGPYDSPPSGFGGGDRFLTKNTEIYGIIEGQYTNNNVYPNRTAPVTNAVQLFEGNAYNSRDSYVEDTGVVSGFNLTACFIEGMDPLIVFKTGDLAGQEFVIWKWDDTNKRIHFNAQSDEDGYTTPNPSNVAKVNDLYTLVNIALPQSYIDTAEETLMNETATWLNENSVPMVVYTIDIDPKYAKTNQVTLKAGDRVTIIDTALGINNMIRIAAVEYPLTNTYKIKATIADHVPYTQNERVVQTTVSNTTETRIVDRTSDELARRNAMRHRQLLAAVFDADGYFDGSRIRPLTVETMALTVGAKSQNFKLIGVTIHPNYLGDANRLYCSTGELHHFEIPDSNGYDWIIGSAYDSGSTLDPAKYYYLYAKCHKASNGASWELTEAQLMADGPDGYYHFLVGILYDVYEGVRDYDFTYGMTYINGRTITTGRIQSLDELMYLDLTEGTFRLGDDYAGIDWSVTEEGTLTIHGVLVQRSPGGPTYGITIYRGAYNAVTVYERGDMVTYGGQTWIYINVAPAAGVEPVEGPYWTLSAAAGEPGTQGFSPAATYQGEWIIGKDYYGTHTRVDIVHYNGTMRYYIAVPRDTTQPFKGVAPDAPGAEYYWAEFGGNFESIATQFLFAENSYLENVGVRFLQGVPELAGTLDGDVDHTLANQTGSQREDYITLSGYDGQANITCNLMTRTIMVSSGNLYDAMDQFVENFGPMYEDIGVRVYHPMASSSLWFCEMNGEDFSGATEIDNLTGDIDGTVYNQSPHSTSQKQIDTITLKGSGGSADIRCNNQTFRAAWDDSLTKTASNFAETYDPWYRINHVIVTSDGPDIIFTAEFAGDPFYLETIITPITTNYDGAISIRGNHIWENYSNNELNSAICINMKGYQEGQAYGRRVIIGDGYGNKVMELGGRLWNQYFFLYSGRIVLNMDALPTSITGLEKGRIWVAPDGSLRIKQ